MDFMDFTEGCKDIFNKVYSKIAIVEAKKLYENGELEKAKKKLLSIGRWELSNSADASYLLANVYLKLINNYTRSDDIAKIHKEITKHLTVAIALHHQEAKYLYYKYYDGLGNLKDQTSNNDSSNFSLADGISIQSKEIRSLLNSKFEKYIDEYNRSQGCKELHSGMAITSEILDKVHHVFPSIKKEDIFFYKYGARHNWAVFCANHCYHSSGEYANLSEIVKVEQKHYNNPLVCFYRDGKTSLVSFPKEKSDFIKLVKVVQDFEKYIMEQGNEFFEKKKYDIAYPYLLECANVFNNTDAQRKMAILYKNGYYVKKDAEKAAYYEGLVNKKKIKSVQTKSIKKPQHTPNYDRRALYKTLYDGYHYDKCEIKLQDKLWTSIRNLGLEMYIKYKSDIMGAKYLDKSNKNIVLFLNKLAVYVLGKNKTVIHYDTLKRVTFDSKTFTVHQLDGSTYQFEHCNNEMFKIANTLNRFAGIVNKDVLSANGKMMITNENVDFDFVKYTSIREIPDDFNTLEKMYLGYTSMPGYDPYYSEEAIKYISSKYLRIVDERNPAYITHKNVDYKFKKYVWGNVPKNFESLEKMYFGYTSMPEDHPEQINEDVMREIKYDLAKADLQDKYLQLQEDCGLISAHAKLIASRIKSYKNLSSIVSEIWHEIIKDYMEHVKEPYINETRFDGDKTIVNKVFWFEIVMDILKERADREILNGEKPVAYAAYQVFNPSLFELEKSELATFEGKPISQILGKEPSAVDVMKLFNISTSTFYSYMRKTNPYAFLFDKSYNDMSGTKVQTLNGIVISKESTGTKSSFYSRPHTYSYMADDRYSHMSFIEYGIKNRDMRTYYRSSVDLERDKYYLKYYEDMSDRGILLFTCFLCEQGEYDVNVKDCTGQYVYVPKKFYDRRDEQYAKLRKELDLEYKIYR